MIVAQKRYFNKMSKNIALCLIASIQGVPDKLQVNIEVVVNASASLLWKRIFMFVCIYDLKSEDSFASFTHTCCKSLIWTDLNVK